MRIKLIIFYVFMCPWRFAAKYAPKYIKKSGKVVCHNFLYMIYEEKTKGKHEEEY